MGKLYVRYCSFRLTAELNLIRYAIKYESCITYSMQHKQYRKLVNHSHRIKFKQTNSVTIRKDYNDRSRLSHCISEAHTHSHTTVAATVNIAIDNKLSYIIYHILARYAPMWTKHIYNTNNNNIIKIIIKMSVITRTMFTVLSPWKGHSESSLGSCDEYMQKLHRLKLICMSL